MTICLIIIIWIITTFVYGFLVLAKREGIYELSKFDKFMIFPLLAIEWVLDRTT